jgi:hypothetical protein
MQNYYQNQVPASPISPPYPNSAHLPEISPSLAYSPQPMPAYPPTAGYYPPYGQPMYAPASGNQNHSFTAGMPPPQNNPSYGQNDSSALIQKLLEELNNKYEDEIETQNQDLMNKIQQIERENQRLAKGIDSDDEDDAAAGFKNYGLHPDDQKIVGDAVDRAIKQYEQSKAREEAGLREKYMHEEERMRRFAPRPRPEEILFAPVTDDEIFNNATSLPPVSKPFIPPSLYNVRGHSQLDHDKFERSTIKTETVPSRGNLSEFSGPKPDKGEVKNLIAKSMMKNDLISSLLKKNKNPPANVASRQTDRDANELMELKRQQERENKLKEEEELKRKLFRQNGYFDANKAKGKNLDLIFKKVKDK